MLRILFLALFLIVSWLLLSPNSELPEVEVSDKAAHVLVFSALMLSGGLAFERKRYVLTSAVLLSYGALVEILQPLVNRNASIYDVFANLTGVITGLVLLYLLDQQIWKLLKFLKITR